MASAELNKVGPAVTLSVSPWTLFSSTLASLLGSLRLHWRRRHPHPQPPDVIALHALQALAAEQNQDLEARRRYHVRARAILGAYVEARFRVNVSDLTTDETLESLNERQVLPDSERSRLRSFFLQTDAVKFMRKEPSGLDCDDVHALAYGFVSATRA